MAAVSKQGRRHAAGTPGSGLLGQAWLVLGMATVFGVALAAVQAHLSGAIAANKRNETLEKVPGVIWGESTAGGPADPSAGADVVPEALTLQKGGRPVFYPLFRVQRQGRLSGWAVKASGQGYAGRIELLLGLDPEADRLLGVDVLEQKETPGLGSRITEDPWRRQFAGKSTASALEVGRAQPDAENRIDGITGATISSRAVAAIVNRTVNDVKAHLAREGIRERERTP